MHPNQMKELLKVFENLSMNDRLFIIQRLMQREILVQIGMDNHNFWIQKVSGIHYPGGED